MAKFVFAVSQLNTYRTPRDMIAPNKYEAEDSETPCSDRSEQSSAVRLICETRGKGGMLYCCISQRYPINLDAVGLPDAVDLSVELLQ